MQELAFTVLQGVIQAVGVLLALTELLIPMETGVTANFHRAHTTVTAMGTKEWENFQVSHCWEGGKCGEASYL